MISYLLTVAVTVLACQFYNHHISKVVANEHPRRLSWEDFIEANINACKTSEECIICRKLIELFDKKFRGKIPAQVFYDHIEIFWNRLDTKYKVIKKQEEMSELTIDQLLN
jgi:hypothetical protein